MRRRRGFALAVVMSLIVILVLIALAVGSTGIATLNQAGTRHLSMQSVYAAEAGLGSAFREIVQGNAWTGYTDVAYGRESRYTVVATAGPAAAGPSHPAIPAATVYLLATGTTRGRYARRVGVLLAGSGAPGAAGGGYALAGGARIREQGNGTVAGSIKASGDVRTQGSFKIIPFQGSGRIAAGGRMELANNTRRDPSQELRARDTISIGPGNMAMDPVRLIFPGDTTPASAPWIADGSRFSNTLNPGDIGEVLPNPNPELLLGLLPDGAGGYLPDGVDPSLYQIDPARTDVVQHSEVDGAGLNLNNQIHFYPNGFSLSGNANVAGTGTIVVGNGKDIQIQGNHTLNANLIALRWPSQMPSSGNPSIDIGGNVDINGMILAHEKISVSGNFRLKGMLIAYHGDLELQGNKRISYDAAGFGLPGLQSWQATSTPPSGPGTLGIAPGQPLKILSWQRL